MPEIHADTEHNQILIGEGEDSMALELAAGDRPLTIDHVGAEDGYIAFVDPENLETTVSASFVPPQARSEREGDE